MTYVLNLTLLLRMYNMCTPWIYVYSVLQFHFQLFYIVIVE